MENKRNCPVCEHQESKTLYSTHHDQRQQAEWTVVQCAACGMVYLAEKVTYREQVEDFDWQETFQKESRRRDVEMPLVRLLSRGAGAIKQLARGRARLKIIRVVLRHTRSGRLFDCGCGAGRLLAEASKFFAVSGIDISAGQAARARRRVPDAEILVGPVTRMRLPGGSLDVFTMQSYIEHEQEPTAALKLAFDALGPGGVLVLKTPNFGSFNRRVRAWKWCGIRLPDHCNYFTPGTLHLALQNAGFELLRGSISDCLPTSDNMYVSARKPAGE